MPETIDATTLVGTSDAPLGSPLWWRDELSGRLAARRPRIDTYQAYKDGEHPLVFATQKFKEAFGDLFSEFADNWCEVVVQASAERLAIEGFRLDGAEEADEEVWDLWQESRLDASSSLAMEEAIALEETYALIEPGEKPRVTIEHPSQFIVATDPGDRRIRRAALKEWIDDDGIMYWTVYLPDAVHRFRSRTDADRTAIPRDDAPAVVRHNLGEVPAVPIVNSPTLLGGGRSDLRVVIPMQNGVNKLVTDMIVASEFAAFKQRLLSGVEVPTYPEGHPQAGEPMDEVFVTAVSRLLTTENPDARAQEFEATDLGNYVKGVEMLIQHLAAQTRTPPHYLLGTMVNASGDALKAAETGLVSKVKGKARTFGEDWEDVVRLMLKAAGREAPTKIETAWANPEHRSEAEVADATVKLKELEIPVEFLWERAGFSQAQIAKMKKARIRAMAEAQALLAAGRPDAQGIDDELPEAADDEAPTGAQPGGAS